MSLQGLLIGYSSSPSCIDRRCVRLMDGCSELTLVGCQRGQRSQAGGEALVAVLCVCPPYYSKTVSSSGGSITSRGGSQVTGYEMLEVHWLHPEAVWEGVRPDREDEPEAGYRISSSI